ncbi:tetratricopeptide repeat protein 6-like [Lingula anatina]|uniref:Tetratricopeptide repeat protein 6-like n=1 Tax=Lingula anatina TaxID=7574 RepID=A0A2R2MT32_LINAN|nr:tetratricopeptide repeat protein 6-like [Lingula anatina]|eukprot:XP_023933182.1 tetratricopeptide repeat protein 6-like [Lingula anatina]
MASIIDLVVQALLFDADCDDILPFLCEEFQEFADAIHNKGAPLKNCVGFVDGTVRPLCRPTFFQRVCYNGHKRVHAIKFQSIVTPDGLIANLFGPVEGRRHDCFMLTLSGILEDFERGQWMDRDGDPFSIYGDPAYPLRDFLIPPYRTANLTPQQELFNAEMSSAFYQRGLSRIRLKQGKGIQDFNRALALDPKIFQVYLSRAAYYGLRGQYSKAILNCNEAIKLQPNSVRAYLFRGALKYHIKAYQLAIRDLTKATSIDSTCALAYFNRAVCYHDSKNHAKALQDYGIVLLLGDALRLKVLINRGLLYFDRDDYRNALQDFLLAAKIDAKNCKIYHTIGLCYHKLNCLEDAVKAFSVALTLDKFFLEGYIGRGNVLMDYGHDAGLKFARRDYERALQLNPIYLPARVNLAYNLQVCGKYMHAWRQFTAALTANPYYKPALEGRAIVNLQMSDTFAAFQDINASVRVVPSAELLTNRGVIHQFMGDKANAMRDYQQAISIDPSHALAYFNAANIYFQMRQFKQAHAHYDKAILFNPKDESALLNRAITKVLLRDSAGALDDFKAAVKLSPHSAHMYFNRGNLYSSLKQFDKAEKDYTKALTLQPDDALVYKRRADVRGKLGKKAEAIADYKYAIEIQSKKRATIDANSVTFKPGSHSK